MNRITIDNWKNANLNLGGTREKIVVEDPETGLLCVVKFRIASYDSNEARRIARDSKIKNIGDFDLHEYLAYMINNEIGIPSARVRLGIHNGSKCSITDYCYNKNNGESLISFGNEEIRHHYNAYSYSSEPDKVKSAFQVLFNIVNDTLKKDAFNKNIDENDFQAIVTGICNRYGGGILKDDGDLHIGNFSVVANRSIHRYNLAVAYDNEKCFEYASGKELGPDGKKYGMVGNNYAAFPYEEILKYLLGEYKETIMPLSRTIASAGVPSKTKLWLEDSIFEEFSDNKKQKIIDALTDNTKIFQEIAGPLPSRQVLQTIRINTGNTTSSTESATTHITNRDSKKTNPYTKRDAV